MCRITEINNTLSTKYLKEPHFSWLNHDTGSSYTAMDTCPLGGGRLWMNNCSSLPILPWPAWGPWEHCLWWGVWCLEARGRVTYTQGPPHQEPTASTFSFHLLQHHTHTVPLPCCCCCCFWLWWNYSDGNGEETRWWPKWWFGWSW